VKWFGEPWPDDWRENGRAPVCADDAERVAVPAGEHLGPPGMPPRPPSPVHLYCLVASIWVPPEAAGLDRSPSPEQAT
jgi:hypothetical protein